MTDEQDHPLPWIIAPTGDDHIVTDVKGELVYIGPDSGEVVRLYNAAVEGSRSRTNQISGWFTSRESAEIECECHSAHCVECRLRPHGPDAS